MERGDGAYAQGSEDRGLILRRLAHRPDTMQDWAGMVAERGPGLAVSSRTSARDSSTVDGGISNWEKGELNWAVGAQMHIVLYYHAAEEGGLLPYGRLSN